MNVVANIISHFILPERILLKFFHGINVVGHIVIHMLYEGLSGSLTPAPKVWTIRIPLNVLIDAKSFKVKTIHFTEE